MTTDINRIEMLRNFPDLLPVRRDNFENVEVKVVNRAHHICKNYLSANRRGFYKIVFLNKGTGRFTLGLNEYHLDKPSILFINPEEIISWKNLAPGSESTGYFFLFTANFLREHSSLQIIIDKHGFFKFNGSNVVHLSNELVEEIDQLFATMFALNVGQNQMADTVLQAYAQLLIIKSSKAEQYKDPAVLNDQHQHVYRFFELLEREYSSININKKLQLKTAQEFADHLKLHPNYLNSLLKLKTGQNLKTHIKGKLLEEGKLMLLYTNHSVQKIGEALGFKDQPNFSRFFKTQSGLSPQEFRQTILSRPSMKSHLSN